jgi:hypothetical protein
MGHQESWLGFYSNEKWKSINVFTLIDLLVESICYGSFNNVKELRFLLWELKTAVAQNCVVWIIRLVDNSRT